MVLSISLFCSQIYAQSPGIAADKQKQENLEKINAHQKEMKKKYNSLSPEEKNKLKQEQKNTNKAVGRNLPENPRLQSHPLHLQQKQLLHRQLNRLVL